MRGYEDNLGEPLRAVREDVEKAWVDKFDVEVKLREEKEAWADELVKQLEKEKKVMFSLSPSRSFCPWVNWETDDFVLRTAEAQIGIGTMSVSIVRQQVQFAWSGGTGPFKTQAPNANPNYRRGHSRFCRTTAEQGDTRG